MRRIRSDRLKRLLPPPSILALLVFVPLAFVPSAFAAPALAPRASAPPAVVPPALAPPASAPPALAPSPEAAETKRIFAIPPTQWDTDMTRDRPAHIYGASDVANLTGGIVFGQPPSDVNALLPTPEPGVEWAGLPFANEYPEDVRYFWVRLDTVPALREGIHGCVGSNSYVVFLFRDQALFRISWRLLQDSACPSAHDAARDVYARYLAIDKTAALTIHYRAGGAEVVEVTDPGADELIPYRWENRGRR